MQKGNGTLFCLVFIIGVIIVGGIYLLYTKLQEGSAYQKTNPNNLLESELK